MTDNTQPTTDVYVKDMEKKIMISIKKHFYYTAMHQLRDLMDYLMVKEE